MRVCAVFADCEEFLTVWSVVEELRRRDVETLTVHLKRRPLPSTIFALLGFDADKTVELEGCEPAGAMAIVLRELPGILEDFGADWVVLHGGGEASVGAAIAAYYCGCRVGHLGSGLRFAAHRRTPLKEFCRRAAESLATLLAAPTKRAAENLASENRTPEAVLLSGSTLAESLTILKAELQKRDDILQGMRARLGMAEVGAPLLVVHVEGLSEEDSRTVLNGAGRVKAIFPDVAVFAVAEGTFGGGLRMVAERRGIEVREGVDALELLLALPEGVIVASGEGWFQEAAAVFRFGLILLDEVTDRPQALDGGWAVLAGLDKDKIAKTSALMVKRWMAPGAATIEHEGASKKVVDALLKR